METAGTIDFYPGSEKCYGCNQPGCSTVENIESCSHSLSHSYYKASIKEAKCLASHVCHGGPKSGLDNCEDILNNDRPKVTMGYWASPQDIAAGSYVDTAMVVEVNSTSPYCEN